MMRPLPERGALSERSISTFQGRFARATAPRLGLATPVANTTLGAVAAEALAIARAGLRARGRRDAEGRDEVIYLQPLEAIVAAGRTRAEDLLADYEGRWGACVRPAFTECVF
ncbi:hypothetical protein OMR07_20650 [Methylobacterium organophilum]|nr:hypothetical protein [Methylobacterium organophilum]